MNIVLGKSNRTTKKTRNFFIETSFTRSKRQIGRERNTRISSCYVYKEEFIKKINAITTSRTQCSVYEREPIDWTASIRKRTFSGRLTFRRRKALRKVPRRQNRRFSSSGRRPNHRCWNSARPPRPRFPRHPNRSECHRRLIYQHDCTFIFQGESNCQKVSSFKCDWKCIETFSKNIYFGNFWRICFEESFQENLEKSVFANFLEKEFRRLFQIFFKKLSRKTREDFWKTYWSFK